MRSSRRFSARSSGRSSGTRAPASSERCPSSTAPGSSSSRTPRPSQAGQAPWRLLNEKSRGSSGGKPVAHDGQKSCSEYSRSVPSRSEEHKSELQSPCNLVCRLLLEKKNPEYSEDPRDRPREGGPDRRHEEEAATRNRDRGFREAERLDVHRPGHGHHIEGDTQEPLD